MRIESVMTKDEIKDEIKAVLDLHGKWLRGEEGGQRADLSDADLRGVDLNGVNLSGATMPNRVKWETYISETVPALLTVGGKALADLRPAFTRHDWTNCPMAKAFGAHDLDEIPSRYRSEAALFIALFDAGAITEELIFGEAVSV